MEGASKTFVISLSITLTSLFTSFFVSLSSVFFYSLFIDFWSVFC